MPEAPKSSVPLRCGCGALRGSVEGASPRYGIHVVCYCDDCQAFQRFLGQGDEILDEHGGSEIYQVSSGRVSFDEGFEHLAVVRLSAKGMCRWYASCCNTPIANTVASPVLPFAGLHVGALAPAGSLEDAIGPIRMRVNARFALGDLAGIDAHSKAPVSALRHILPMVYVARFRGEQRRSPFFDATTGQPVVKPTILDENQRSQLEPEAS